MERRPLVLVGGQILELPQIDTLPGGGSGGGAMQFMTVDVPYSSKHEVAVTVAVPGMTANSKIMCELAGTTDSDENELEDLNGLQIRANPKTNALEFLFSGLGVFGGPIKVFYLVGA